MKDNITRWTDLTNEITESWIKDYFELDEDEYIDADWVEIGGVFNFADYWFSFSSVLDCYELGVTKKKLFEWYDKSLTQEIDLPLREFIISPKKLKEQKKKYLEDLKQKVELAKEELEKAIKDYDTSN